MIWRRVLAGLFGFSALVHLWSMAIVILTGMAWGLAVVYGGIAVVGAVAMVMLLGWDD